MLRRTNFAFLSQSYEKSSEMQKEFLLFYPCIIAAPYQGALNLFISERK